MRAEVASLRRNSTFPSCALTRPSLPAWPWPFELSSLHTFLTKTFSPFMTGYNQKQIPRILIFAFTKNNVLSFKSNALSWIACPL